MSYQHIGSLMSFSHQVVMEEVANHHQYTYDHDWNNDTHNYHFQLDNHRVWREKGSQEHVTEVPYNHQDILRSWVFLVFFWEVSYVSPSDSKPTTICHAEQTRHIWLFLSLYISICLKMRPFFKSLLITQEVSHLEVWWCSTTPRNDTGRAWKGI